jgi:BlaI family penicillinase repressor
MKKDLATYILTRQEHLIMSVIWKLGGATAREVFDVLFQKKNLAYTTILTHMQILRKKGVLIRRSTGRTHRYSPVLLKEQATKNQVEDLLNRYFDGNPDRLVTAMQSEKFLQRAREAQSRRMHHE